MESKGVILLVDDDRTLLKAMKAILEYQGYTVVTAANGFEASKILRERAREFCLVLTDYEMHPGPSGMDVLRTAKEHDPELPVIVMSGILPGETNLQTELIAHGAAAAISKSYDLGEFIKLVGQCARGSHG